MEISEADILDWVKEWCNNSFSNEYGQEILPGGVKIFIPKALQYLQQKAGIQSRTMGSVSYSFEADFPPSLLRLIRPYKRVRFR
ncbi:head-tail connector protein [Metabacillus idriensis]|uniref:hypothetical protein n=1 Tax=Metabacillus idriensis TaxID=324768 RepID=UPI00174994D4|nr:hypothetical protein [Metabacillus idriensis]